jgi:hypothetical protein
MVDLSVTGANPLLSKFLLQVRFRRVNNVCVGDLIIWSRVEKRPVAVIFIDPALSMAHRVEICAAFLMALLHLHLLQQMSSRASSWCGSQLMDLGNES